MEQTESRGIPRKLVTLLENYLEDRKIIVRTTRGTLRKNAYVTSSDTLPRPGHIPRAGWQPDVLTSSRRAFNSLKDPSLLFTTGRFGKIRSVTYGAVAPRGLVWIVFLTVARGPPALYTNCLIFPTKHTMYRRAYGCR